MRRFLIHIVVCHLSILVGFSSSAFSDTGDTRVEAESFVAYDMLGSGFPLVVPDSHASGSLAVDGFNAAGMWLEFDVTLASPLWFQFGVVSAGQVGLVREYSLTLVPVGSEDPIVEDILRTPPGLGAGWTCTYDWVQSSKVKAVPAGQYRMRITRAGTPGATRLDCVDLVFSPTPVSAVSWGKLRTLYLP